MDLLALGLLIPLLPLFLIPVFLVGTAWIDRQRRASHRRSRDRGTAPRP